jgi:esterase/lipase
MFQEYNSLISQIWEKTREIRQIMGEDTNTDTKKKELTDAEKGKVAELKKELNDLRVRKDAITSGKRAPEFIATALYEASAALHGHRRGYTLEGFVKFKTGKNINEISETELEKLKEEYKAYRDTEMKNDILGDAKQFVDLVGMSSNAIK